MGVLRRGGRREAVELRPSSGERGNEGRDERFCSSKLRAGGGGAGIVIERERSWGRRSRREVEILECEECGYSKDRRDGGRGVWSPGNVEWSAKDTGEPAREAGREETSG